MRLIRVLGLLVTLASVCRGGDDPVALLEKATRDVDRGVRFAAVEALGKAGAGIEAVVVALDDPEWCVRQAAGRALARIGKPALPHLERIMKTGKPLARVEAVEAARWIGAEGSSLVVAALNDEDARIRLEALEGVWLLGKEKLRADPVARIRELARTKNAETRLAALLALSVADAGSRDIVVRGARELRDLVKGDRRSVYLLGLLEKSLKPPTSPPAPPLFELKDLQSEHAETRAKALVVLRQRGSQFKVHESAIAKLIEQRDAGIARDAAIALELIGADAIGRVLDHGPVRAALYCKSPPKDEVKLALEMLHSELSDAELGDWVLLLGRIGVRSDAVEEALREAAKHRDDRVRALAIRALGRLGIGVPEALGDRSAVVRELAMPYVRDVRRLVAILNGSHREARILAAQRLGQLRRWDPLLAATSHPDPLLRIAVARSLGERCTAVMAKDEARDVRIAAASVLRGPVLLHALKDRNWRVRAAAVRSLGKVGTGIVPLALLLGSRNYAIGVAAFEALQRIGGPSALAVGRGVDNGNEAVWHYAPKLFESFGAAGIAGVGPLVAALQHPNPTAREVAARCIGAVGPDAVAASPALVAALGDRRLGVVSHAALALGRIGVTDSVLGALTHEKARVRAYAAFAIGWALGARRGFDQAFFEPRLPVLDCGEPDPGVTLANVRRMGELSDARRLRLCRRGLRSMDPRIANPCAAQLDFDSMNAWECERAVELVIAEGFRRGNRFDFEAFRSYIGSNELPACLAMTNLARACSPPRYSIHAALHRSPRSENIPALLWFQRNEDVIRMDDFYELLQPLSETDRFRRERSSGVLWEDVERAGGLENPLAWWLESEPIPEAREALLIRIIDESPGRGFDQGPAQNRWSALRALGRASSGASARYLRWVATRGGGDGTVALASLARRGDPDALLRLVEESKNDNVALGLLIETQPELGVVLLRERLADSATAKSCADSVGSIFQEVDALFGVRWPPDALLGVEPAIPIGVLDRQALEAIGMGVPGCWTTRIGAAILDRLEQSGFGDYDDTWEPTVGALLESTDSGRLRRILRAADDADKESVAIEILARLRDPADEARIVAWIGRGDVEHSDLAGWRSPRIVQAVLAKKDADIDLLVATQSGFWLGDEWEESEIRTAYRQGRGLAAARKLIAERIDTTWESGPDDVGPRLPWMKLELKRRYDAREYGSLDVTLGRLATWDADARAEYWSILRAGRYRWIVDWEESYAMTLGYDFATLPHWAEELESNCCRISGRVAGMFEDLFRGIEDLYGCADYGIGQPGSRRVRSWFELYGGDMRWSRIGRRFVPAPE